MLLIGQDANKNYVGVVSVGFYESKSLNAITDRNVSGYRQCARGSVMHRIAAVVIESELADCDTVSAPIEQSLRAADSGNRI